MTESEKQAFLNGYTEAYEKWEYKYDLHIVIFLAIGLVIGAGIVYIASCV